MVPQGSPEGEGVEDHPNEGQEVDGEGDALVPVGPGQEGGKW